MEAGPRVRSWAWRGAGSGRGAPGLAFDPRLGGQELGGPSGPGNHASSQGLGFLTCETDMGSRTGRAPGQAGLGERGAPAPCPR